jgi:hypothetical protein
MPLPQDSYSAPSSGTGGAFSFKTAQHKSQRSDDHAHWRGAHPPPSAQNERRVTPGVPLGTSAIAVLAQRLSSRTVWRQASGSPRDLLKAHRRRPPHV